MASPYDKARVRIVIKEPFFACLLLGMETVETEVLPGGRPLWMAATDGSTLYVNRKNLDQCPLSQIIGVLKHELMHAALLHPFRVGNRDPGKAGRAMDYVINDMIIHEGGELPDGILHDPHNWNRHKMWEEIYAQMPDPPKGGSGQNNGGGKGQGQQQQQGGNPLDDDVLPAPDQSDEAKRKMTGRVVKAAQVAKAIGKLPSYLEGLIADMLDPKVPWEQELAEFLTEVSRNDYTFARPNRRFIYEDLYLPSAYSHDTMGRLAVVFDTSGSVSDHEMRSFASELVGAIEGVLPMSLAVIYCDAAVQHVDYFDAPTVDDVTASLKRHGRGGTHMPTALDWIDENLDDVKAAIVFTDGYTDFGHERDYPVLWGITSRGITADMGRTVHVDID